MRVASGRNSGPTTAAGTARHSAPCWRWSACGRIRLIFLQQVKTVENSSYYTLDTISQTWWFKSHLQKNMMYFYEAKICYESFCGLRSKMSENKLNTAHKRFNLQFCINWMSLHFWNHFDDVLFVADRTQLWRTPIRRFTKTAKLITTHRCRLGGLGLGTQLQIRHWGCQWVPR